ncbi:MAG: diaminopropionate ammonia-lyase [Gammaproteobacteria bacterium]|nr:diaminopropionate ammonia-lyase [Gammaproteobacteria bacterium]
MGSPVTKVSTSESGYGFALAQNRLYRNVPYGPEQKAILDEQAFQQAAGIIRSWPGYKPTLLRDLSFLAQDTGVAQVLYKDESERFGLSSFKPLGGAYAVVRALISGLKQATGKENIEPQDILDGRYKERVSGMTVTAATDGNHGRSVAWGASLFGCRCVIFIHETVSPGRERAIARLGAEVRRNPGTYDDAVRKASAMARDMGWYPIPDTSDGVETEAPKNVMRGYALMAQEVIDSIPPHSLPTHIFLQAGVGGMAAAVAAQFWRRAGAKRIKVVLVEPEQAACWYHSLEAGKPVDVRGELDSVMAGLACGEVSMLAWPILAPVTSAMMTVEDAAAVDCMGLLAEGRLGDAPMVAGESAVAGLAGFLAAAADNGARKTLGIDADSRILLFGTEGASDPETYTALTGLRPEAIGKAGENPSER